MSLPRSRPLPTTVHPPIEERHKYQTIYPQYLDAHLSPFDGRRLTASQSVGSPSLEEIYTSLKEMGFMDCYVEGTKSLPRAQSQARQVPAPCGCIKIIIKEPPDVHYVKRSEFDQQTREPRSAKYSTKRQILIEVARRIKLRPGQRPPPHKEPANEAVVQVKRAGHRK